MATFLGSIFGIGETKKATALEKRVAQVNELINQENKQGLEVVDSSTSWQAPMKYKPIKTSRGIIYVTYEKLDLYKYNRGKGTSWEKNSERWGADDARYILNDIAKMYRKALKSYSVYGY